MFDSPWNSSKKIAIIAAFAFIQTCCLTWAQNFTARSANINPFGVNGPLPFGGVPDFGGGQGLKGGFAYGVGLSSTYDSNILLSEDNPESDVYLSFLPTVNYTTDPEGGAPVVISASYSPSANAYLNNSDNNSFDQTGSISMVIAGSRTTISAFAGISQDSGADNLAPSQGFFTGTAVSLGLQAGYQLAPRTLVSAGWESSITDYGDGSAVGFGDNSFNLAGLWAATERLSFGPNFSYTTSSSDNTGDFDTWGFSMQGIYKVSEKIQVAAAIGFQYSQYSQEGASSDLAPTGSLNANYQIDELWSWSSSIQSGLTPSPTESNYAISDWLISSNLNRQLLVGSVGIGIVMDFSNYQSVGDKASQASQDSQQNIGFSLNYSRPLPFSHDRVGFTSSLTYTLNYGDIEYSQILLNAGLSMTF